MSDPIFILTCFLIAGVMSFLWWKSREDTRNVTMERDLENYKPILPPSGYAERLRVRYAGEATLAEAKKILEDYEKARKKS